MRFWRESTSKLNSVFFIDEKVGWAVGNDGKIFRTAGSGKLWRQQESGTNNNLNDVYFTDANNGWIVGDDGTIMRTRNGGANWYPVNTAAQHRLEKIVFIGENGLGGRVWRNDHAIRRELDQRSSAIKAGPSTPERVGNQSQVPKSQSPKSQI